MTHDPEAEVPASANVVLSSIAPRMSRQVRTAALSTYSPFFIGVMYPDP
jgi:hypothetical protein